MLGSIYYYDYVSSTNNEAKNLAEKYKITSGLVIADCQKHGRGRFGKKWTSIKGNFMGSFFFPVKNYKEVSKMQHLSLNILLKCFKKIFKSTIFKIKEPNDILIGDRKISGILIESFKVNRQLFVIVGMGINLVKNPMLSEYKTTNLYKELKKKMSVLDFSKILIKEMESVYKCS